MTEYLRSRAPIADSVLDLVGQTPMVRLSRVSAPGRAVVVGKLEAKNQPLLVGHNVKFDEGFMDALWEITGVKRPYAYHAMCTMGIAQVCKQLGVLDTANIKLETLVRHFSIEFGSDGAHNALADALATRLVHLELVHLLRPGVVAA